MAKQQQHRSWFAATGAFLLGLTVISIGGALMLDWLAQRRPDWEASTNEAAFRFSKAYVEAVMKLELREGR